MEKIDIFSMNKSEVNRDNLLKHIENNTAEVLKSKASRISEINRTEIARYSSIKHKAEILFGLHISLLSLIAGGVSLGPLANLFEERTSSSTIIFGVTLALMFLVVGLIRAVQVATLPKFVSFNDPNLWFKKHNNEEDWLKSVIIKETSNYRKNIDIISSEAKRTNQAFDFWILAAMTLLLSVLMAQALASLKLYVLNSCTFIAGMIIVLVCGIIIIYWELTREPKYQGRIKTTE